MKLKDLKHGQKITCMIDGTEITDARISINEDGRYHICQNKIDGVPADDKLGYKCSWFIGRDDMPSYITDFKVVEETKFKVGERVRTKKEGGYNFDPSLATITIVPSGESKLYCLDVDNDKLQEWPYYEDQFDKIDESEDTRELKVGDKVVIKKNEDDSFFDKYIGDVATILSIHPSGCYEIDLPIGSGEETSYWDKEEIELLERQKTKDKKKGGVKKMRQLARKLLDADVRTLIKARVLRDDLTVCDKDFVMEFLVSQFKKELAVEAKKLIKERKREEE